MLTRFNISRPLAFSNQPLYSFPTNLSIPALFERTTHGSSTSYANTVRNACRNAGSHRGGTCSRRYPIERCQRELSVRVGCRTRFLARTDRGRDRGARQGNTGVEEADEVVLPGDERQGGPHRALHHDDGVPHRALPEAGQPIRATCGPRTEQDRSHEEDGS